MLAKGEGHQMEVRVGYVLKMFPRWFVGTIPPSRRVRDGGDLDGLACVPRLTPELFALSAPPVLSVGAERD